MTWLALYDNRARAVSPKLPDAALDRGTLMFELDLALFARSAGPLLRLAPRREPRRMFVIERYSDGRLHLLRRDGREVSHLSIGLGREPISGVLRFTHHWDAPRAISLLTAENLTRGTIRQQEDRSGLAVDAEAVASLMGGTADCTRSPALNWLAIGDHWQTVGPLPGLAAETLISTPDGPRPVSALCPGDLVFTRDHGALPILWQGRSTVPGAGTMRRVRFRAPYFRLNHDLVLQSRQRIALTGADVEYHFGESEMMVEAHHFVDGQTAVWDTASPLATSHGILLDRHALVEAGGVWTETLYLGRIGRTGDLARSICAGALAERGEMPLHHGQVRRELADYEVQMLLQARRRARAPLAA
ncbi:Hint domain-containing protein [Albidovulum sp.]|uniref:Hint domain-containing protein n=1 Tax=Albidovulum sp. TaxID=1872424 RepID=UPI001D6AFF18|nr:Hint domain-containing protein [Paracoccaceae bacterium]